MEGIFNMRSSLPRYHHTWNVNCVLNHLSTQDISTAPLSKLTMKVVMLLALLSGQRGQTLHALKRNKASLQLTDTTCVFIVNSILKGTIPGKHTEPLKFDCFCSHNVNLCPVHHVKKYLEFTEQIISPGRNNSS